MSTDHAQTTGGFSREDLDLLDLLLERAGETEAAQEQLICPRAHSDSLPLSFAQERLWLLHQLDGSTSAYSVPSAIRFQGRLDVAALRHSLSEIVRRHEILRTTFPAIDGQPIQRIAPAQPLPLPCIEVAGATPETRSARARQLIAAEIEQPFDLERGPLVRATLFRLCPGDDCDEHILVLTIHHIVVDGWSISILHRELRQLYAAVTHGRPSPLPELAIQYADFAIWQRAEPQQQLLDEQLRYWRQQLDPQGTGGPPVLQLPTDRPRPPVQSHRGAHHPFQLSPDLARALAVLSQHEATSPFTVLLAAFNVLLYRYSGQDDLCVGSYIANRNRADILDLIGYFVNTLALRTSLAGRPSFRETIARVREVTLEAYAHQDLPFERLLEAIQPQRSTSHTPLFQVALVFQNTPETIFELPGLVAEPLELEFHRANFDLTLWMWEEGETLVGSVEYSTDLFDAATIARLAVNFATLLDAAVHDPDAAIEALPLMPADEQRRLLHDWSGPRRDYGLPVGVHQLFEVQATQTPDAVALISIAGGAAGEALTYRQLNERVNQLAHELRAAGVGTDPRGETPVGLLLERSPEFIIALLAVLKAGGAYVPLDPTYPRDRLQLMLDHTRAPVVISRPPAGTALPPDERGVVRRIDLDADADRIARQPRTNPTWTIWPEQAAYILYTSGSTGTPKGVVIQHQSLTNFVQATAEAWEISAADRVLQFASLSWDTSAEEIYPCLTRGGTLVLRGAIEAADLFLELCRAYQLTVVDLPTAYWHELVDALEREPIALPPSLRLVIIGGERAQPERVIAWQRHLGPTPRLLNTYGATEATAITTVYDISAAASADLSHAIAIGRPVGNVQTFILDHAMQPTPIGVPGILYIGGAGVSRGYLNQPALTAAAFVPNPFANFGLPIGDWGLGVGSDSIPNPQSNIQHRLYRTGDWARYRADGQIEYLGRIDQQVKVRGIRIELGEIEAVLREHPATHEAVVAVDQTSGQPRLVAYVVIRDQGPGIRDQEPGLEVGALRSFVQERLPAYMVPGAFVPLDALPLTASGKIDRRRLPAPDWDRLAANETAVAPRTPVEELLAGIWCEVLGRRAIGVHENFFEAGGHSLLATQIIARVRSTLEIALPLRVLFTAPTIAGLAAAIEAEHGQAQELLPPLTPRPRSAVYRAALSFAQQRLWFIEQLLPDTPAHSMTLALRIPGAVRADILQHSIDTIVARHDTLRTTFAVEDGQAIQVIDERGAVVMSRHDLAHLPPAGRAAAAGQIAEQEARRPFDLQRGPLLRVNLARLGQHDYVLIVAMHHIISDDWSIGVLVRELTSLYHSYLHGDPSPLPPLPAQYADFADWQRAWSTSPALAAQLSYWQAQLGTPSPAALDLPADRPRPAVQTMRGERHLLALPSALAATLQQLSRQEQTTLFMTLLAAFKTLLYRYTGQPDIIVGSPVAGRRETALEPLIGFFVNTLVLRTDLGGNPTFRELLGRVRETALGAYAHQDLPFEQLVETLQPARDPGRHPFFQVLFALQNEPLPDLLLDGTPLQPLSIDRKAAQFDLTVALAETADGLVGTCEYNADLFEATTIARMMRHFQRLLEHFAADPDARIGDRALLTGEEWRQRLAWNDTLRPASGARCLHLQVAVQAARTPEALAVVADGISLSYRELERRANGLAHHLRARGVGPDVLVGVYVARSVELVIGLLGVLKAGGAFVPLDPSYPAERIAWMLADTRAPVLLTQRALLERLPAHRATVICLDAELEQLAPPSETAPDVAVSPEHLAYVIYTSGSTGQPKGVMITHRAISNTLHHRQACYPLTAADRVLQATSISFDPAVWELFGPLTVGATLVVSLPSSLEGSAALVAHIRRHAVTTLQFPTPWLQMLLDAPDSAECRSVRRTFCGGQALTPDLLQRYAERLPWATLHHLYGPTEAAIDATMWDCRLPFDQTSVPIGYPISNTRIHLLDAQLQPVPVGVIGELYIEGPGLARGYHNRPDLTAERFIPMPDFGCSMFDVGLSTNQPPIPNGQRLYKTGDLARYRPDGALEFCGRGDQQIKVRGFRIELGEIEQVLLRHPAVQQCAVVARAQPSGQMQLIAYVVGQGPGAAEVGAAELRDVLQQRLPEYMIPAAFVRLDALPLSANGKVDRGALASEERYAPRTAPSAPPRTSLGRALAAIWQEVLRVDLVGLDDNFFDLGGHSLLLMRVKSLISEQLGQEIAVLDLLQHPSIAALAARLRQRHQPAQDQPIDHARSSKLAAGKDRLRHQRERRQRAAYSEES